jgi:ubiquinone/menaquinone biosynthesis C-methylase UbiE
MSHDKPSLKEVQDFWDARPCNVRHSNSQVGTKKYFDEVEERKYFVEPHIPTFADFPNWYGKRVLEIGCGMGTDATNFARNGAIYTGIELSSESLKLAKQRFDVFGLTGRFIEGNAEEIDQILQNETFDLIYSFGVLHHTPNLEKALRGIRTLMHSNSVFKMMVYAENSWKSAMIAAGLDQPEAQYGCPIANTYTNSQITSILEASGFEVTSILQDHVFPFIVEEYKKYNYVRESWFDAMPPEIFQALEKKLGWHLLVTSELRRN